MRFAVRLRALVFTAFVGGQAAPTPESIPPRPYVSATPAIQAGDFELICTVYNGGPPGMPSDAPAIPLSFDPRFEIGARVESVAFGTTPWPPGRLLRFLIHSPTRTFGGYGFSGRRYRLRFRQKISKGSPEFSLIYLAAEPADSEGRTSAVLSPRHFLAVPRLNSSNHMILDA